MYKVETRILEDVVKLLDKIKAETTLNHTDTNRKKAAKLSKLIKNNYLNVEI